MTVVKKFGFLLFGLLSFGQVGFAECDSRENYTSMYFDRFNTMQSSRVQLIFLKADQSRLEMQTTAISLRLKTFRKLYYKGYVDLSFIEALDIELQRQQLELEGVNLRLLGASEEIALQRVRMQEECSTNTQNFDPVTLTLLLKNMSLRWEGSMANRERRLELTRRELKLVQKSLAWNHRAYAKGSIVKDQLQEATNAVVRVEDNIAAAEAANEMSKSTIEAIGQYMTLMD